MSRAARPLLALLQQAPYHDKLMTWLLQQNRFYGHASRDEYPTLIIFCTRDFKPKMRKRREMTTERRLIYNESAFMVQIPSLQLTAVQAPQSHENTCSKCAPCHPSAGGDPGIAPL